METDLERYAWLVAYELREARSADSPEERRDHEMLARAYTLKMHRLENEMLGIVETPDEAVGDSLTNDRPIGSSLNPLQPAGKRDGS